MNIEIIKTEIPGAQITGIIHVGAHAGEEWVNYANNNIHDVVWVEANPNLAGHLKQKFHNDTNKVIINAAIFNEEKILTFNITNNLCSSSLFELKTHKQLYPDVVYNNQIQTHTKRLDTLINNQTIDIQKYNTLVVDVQGAELQVIESLGKYLVSIKYIISEICLTELYEGSTVVEIFDQKLNELGFTKIKQLLATNEWGDALYARI
jgi:FkbM family methyltransferase